METFFFKKLVPATPVYLSNGKKLTFDTVDGQVGYTMTADPALAHQLFAFMHKGIGDISVASAEEYEDFIKKKEPNAPLKRPWREELTPREVTFPGSERSQNVAEVVKAKAPQMTAAQAVVPPAEQIPFKPRTSKKK